MKHMPKSPPARDPTAAERMRRYRAAKRSAGLRLKREWVEAPAAPPPPFSDHAVLEARSLALHCMIARRLHARPELLGKARDNLDRWSRRWSGSPPGYLTQWRAVLSRPLPELLAFITSTTPEAARLRQSTPLVGILSPLERKRVYEAFRA
jgi:hypothetical protein